MSGLGKAGVLNKGLIGKGAFGCVYLVENAEGDQFAVKVMEWQWASPTDKGVVENELSVLKELSHEHVLVYTDHFQDKGLMYIITEYCSGGDLSGFLDQIGSPLPEDLLLAWLWQMACGLEYMHTHENGPILHRDLKPTNVFLSSEGVVRLGDLGIARKLEKPDAMAETFCGTPPYMSPEALFEKPYNTKTDIWSLGCCVVEMATLERAYEGASLFILRNAVNKMREPLPDMYSRQLDDLLSTMLLVDYEDRITATQVLDHPLVQGFEDVKPMDLLVKHRLEFALATHRRSSPVTTTISPSTTIKAKANETLLTLTDSMMNLKDILNEGEPITTYRVKIDGRMRGRRRNDDTITNSASFKTVLYKGPQTARTSKSTSKTLKVPTKRSSAAEKDDTLSRTVLPSLTRSITCLSQSATRTKPRADPSRAGLDALNLMGNASHSTQMETLRTTLSQMVGGETLRQADSLVGSTASRREVQEGLASLVGDQETVLSNVVLYLLLMESASQSKPTV